jgi:hypothetical protein
MMFQQIVGICFDNYVKLERTQFEEIVKFLRVKADGTPT